MILVLTLIILNSIILYLINIKWYYSIVIMLFLMGQIMSLNYETKTIIDRGLLEHNPSNFNKILPRTLSNFNQVSLLKYILIYFYKNIMEIPLTLNVFQKIKLLFRIKSHSKLLALRTLQSICKSNHLVISQFQKKITQVNFQRKDL